jgi:hypothetical protein
MFFEFKYWALENTKQKRFYLEFKEKDLKFKGLSTY